MMRACAGLGHSVSLATVKPCAAEALDGLPLDRLIALDTGEAAGRQWKATRLQEKFRSFYGVSTSRIARLARAADETRADVVVVVGLDGLPYFPALGNVVRVWYAADEWVWHHLSQLKIGDPDLKANIRDALVKGVYERAHRHVVDRAWIVSETERRAMRWLAGMPVADVLPNGVDGEHFAPGDEAQDPVSAVFWGRLDFGPNIQALNWFVRHVWPLIRRDEPDAHLTILGFHPAEAVRSLAGRDGIRLEPDVLDLRPVVRRHALAVLPFVSGGGIKNKLLEAAALGMPIVSTPTAVGGLRGRPPLVTASQPAAFAQAMIGLWRDPAKRRQIGADARAWVLEHHTWTATARDAMDALAGAVEARTAR
jgi:glycosyltransferase involved in cell wall biosynthesis